MEAIIFDLGNVLLTLHWDRMVNHLARWSVYPPHELGEKVAASRWLRQLARGEVTQADCFEGVREELGFRGTFRQFCEAWSDMFSPNEPVLTAAHRLRGRMPRLVLSNTNAIHMQYIFARFPAIYGFDGYILSHELGVEKPDRRIYEWTVRRYRLNRRRTVFVDDVAENVAGARAAGLHAVHYTDAPQTLAELTKLGVPLIETRSTQPTPR